MLLKKKHALNVERLIAWYQRHHRPLPWRKTSNPYYIWVSEVMLQQTTVQTVIPYYQKFVRKFSSLSLLAKAPLEEVGSYWAGLGYYRRVKHLQESAQIIQKNKYFPKTYRELLKLPGFGPYTARAVSALAFGEKTVALDSNGIRVMARYTGFKQAWWDKTGRDFLQTEANRWVLSYPPALVNQALIELGALVCRAKQAKCLLCPLQDQCQAYRRNQIDSIPLKRKKKEAEIWFWEPVVFLKKERVALTPVHSLPVLKDYPLFPGPAFKRKVKPRQYDFRHLVTHHVIYVLPALVPHFILHKQTGVLGTKLGKKYATPIRGVLGRNVSWVKIKDLKKQNPSSLMQKVLKNVFYIQRV